MQKKPPAFGVFGRPSIGKSSIVAALTETEDLEIDSWGGTTTEVTQYRLEVAQQRVTLFDTPGFEKPQQALAWLQQRSGGLASRRAQAIEQFLRDPQCRQDFPVETALLGIIRDGAAILYVVDDSRRYDTEHAVYEAEMEILRWTGQARMGVINPFGDRQFAEDWQDALRQYFDLVRVFNPLEADLEKKKQIFTAFCQIRPEYDDALQQLVAALDRQREQRLAKAVAHLAEMLVGLRTCEVSQQAATKAEADRLKQGLEAQYRSALQQLEQRAHLDLLRDCNYRHLEPLVSELAVPERLFDIDEPWLESLRREFPDWMPGSRPKFAARVGPIPKDSCRAHLEQALHRYLSLFSLLQRRTHAAQEKLQIHEPQKVAEFAAKLTASLPAAEKEMLSKLLAVLCENRWLGERFGKDLRQALRPLLLQLMR